MTQLLEHASPSRTQTCSALPQAWLEGRSFCHSSRNTTKLAQAKMGLITALGEEKWSLTRGFFRHGCLLGSVMSPDVSFCLLSWRPVFPSTRTGQLCPSLLKEKVSQWSETQDGSSVSIWGLDHPEPLPHAGIVAQDGSGISGHFQSWELGLSH